MRFRPLIAALLIVSSGRAEVVQVRVVNGFENNAPLADRDGVLLGLGQKLEWPFRTDADGRFEINLPVVNRGPTYTVRVEIDKHEYFSPYFQVLHAEAVPVYPVTRDGVEHIAVIHRVVVREKPNQPAGASVGVSEDFQFLNLSREAFIGEQPGHVYRIPLPREAQSIHAIGFWNITRKLKVEDGPDGPVVLLQSPVFPGLNRSVESWNKIRIEYDLHPQRTLNLSRTFDFKVLRSEWFLEHTKYTLVSSSENLKKIGQESLPFGKKTVEFDVSEFSHVDDGSLMSVLVEVELLGRRLKSVLWFGFLAAGILGIILLGLITGKKKETVAADLGEYSAAIAAIVSLDRRKEKGEIVVKAFRKERARLLKVARGLLDGQPKKSAARGRPTEPRSDLEEAIASIREELQALETRGDTPEARGERQTVLEKLARIVLEHEHDRS